MARGTRERETPAEPPVRAARQRLEALTPEDTIELGYPEVLRLRRAAYAEHVAAMPAHEEIERWAAQMEAQYGPVAKAWANAVDWPTALLIARYGEAVDAWPEEWPADAIERAATWLGNPAASRGIVPVGARTERFPGERLYGLEEHVDRVADFHARNAQLREQAAQQAATAGASSNQPQG